MCGTTIGNVTFTKKKKNKKNFENKSSISSVLMLPVKSCNVLFNLNDIQCPTHYGINRKRCRMRIVRHEPIKIYGSACNYVALAAIVYCGQRLSWSWNVVNFRNKFKYLSTDSFVALDKEICSVLRIYISWDFYILTNRLFAKKAGDSLTSIREYIKCVHKSTAQSHLMSKRIKYSEIELDEMINNEVPSENYLFILKMDQYKHQFLPANTAFVKRLFELGSISMTEDHTFEMASNISETEKNMNQINGVDCVSDEKEAANAMSSKRYKVHLSYATYLDQREFVISITLAAGAIEDHAKLVEESCQYIKSYIISSKKPIERFVIKLDGLEKHKLLNVKIKKRLIEYCGTELNGTNVSTIEILVCKHNMHIFYIFHFVCLEFTSSLLCFAFIIF